MPLPPGVPGGIGGDVSAVSATSITITDRRGATTTFDINSATMVTKNEQSATWADILTGDNVRIDVSSTDPTLASTIRVMPASVVGKVTAINGDVVTTAEPNGTADSVVVGPATTYRKGDAAASFADISVGTVIFAQGTFGSSTNLLNATTVGIGIGPPGDHGPGPLGTSGPGNLTPGPDGPRVGALPPMKGTDD